MTFQATIHYNETIQLSTNFTNIQLINSRHLILQLDALSPESANQALKIHWQKISQQLPPISAPKLLGIHEVTPRCPRCGATELSFCHH